MDTIAFYTVYMYTHIHWQCAGLPELLTPARTQHCCQRGSRPTARRRASDSSVLRGRCHWCTLKWKNDGSQGFWQSPLTECMQTQWMSLWPPPGSRSLSSRQRRYPHCSSTTWVSSASSVLRESPHSAGFCCSQLDADQQKKISLVTLYNWGRHLGLNRVETETEQRLTFVTAMCSFHPWRRAPYAGQEHIKLFIFWCGWWVGKDKK